MSNQRNAGFTLVELAIVLVIIGLIVGGVLVGQDLIKGAEQRAAVGQLEKYDTAVNTFRGKYNGLPGDLTNPTNFGFVETATAGIISAHGNGVLDVVTTGSFEEEAAMFFGQLSRASMVPETIDPTQAQLTSGGMVANMSTYAPVSKLGKGIYVFAMSTGGVNYYMMDDIALATTGVLTYGHSAMPSITAYGIDTKLDDGLPSTGKVQAVDALATAASATANAGALSGKCVNTTPTPDTYQTSTQAIADAPACTLRIKASF